MNKSLLDAHEIIRTAANASAADCPLSIWSKLLNARKYLDKQILEDYETATEAA